MHDALSEVTSLLSAIERGDANAAERLMSTVQEELRRVAHARVVQEGRRGDVHTTVLVQEAYLRLLGGNGDNMPQNRRQFFAFAANAMRQFLVDDARKRRRLKRGGGRRVEEFDDAVAVFDYDADQVLDVDAALEKLRAVDPAKAKLVELRYFVGLSIDETAEVLGISPRKADAEWHFVKAWLKRELS